MSKLPKTWKGGHVAAGYMCGTDWDCELGEAPGGVPVYSSVEDLKKHKSCWDECGIIKVEVKILDVIDAGKYR